MFVHDPGNNAPIKELWAYISIDENGNEGLCGAPLLEATCMPMVFGFEKTAQKVFPIMEQIAKTTGKTVQLVKFTGREVVQTILPVSGL